MNKLMLTMLVGALFAHTAYAADEPAAADKNPANAMPIANNVVAMGRPVKIATMFMPLSQLGVAVAVPPLRRARHSRSSRPQRSK